MAKVKKIKKAQDGTLCNWSDKKGGGVSCGRRGAPKQDTWKNVNISTGTRKERKQEETRDAYAAGAREPFERDFPGDKAPGGWSDAAKDKSGTRWSTDTKGKMRYVPYSGKKKMGGKVVKKSAVKKAKVGVKIKSKKK
jgi:hypothetical protein